MKCKQLLVDPRIKKCAETYSPKEVDMPLNLEHWIVCSKEVGVSLEHVTPNKINVFRGGLDLSIICMSNI